MKNSSCFEMLMKLVGNIIPPVMWFSGLLVFSEGIDNLKEMASSGAFSIPVA